MKDNTSHLSDNFEKSEGSLSKRALLSDKLERPEKKCVQ